MRFQAPRGTEDILPSQIPAWQHLEQQFRQHTGTYGYGEIRTPTFEDVNLFVRTSGDTSDIVSKEIYQFTDKGGREVALKPENTAPAMRALIEHNLCPQGTVLRLCYVSTSLFRYDRPQKGRLREHHQFGIELVGSPSSRADAEVIEVAVRFFEKLGLTGLVARINSIGRAECRVAYRDALLSHVKGYLDGASEEFREKVLKNPLRLLDSKDDGARAALVGAPSILDYLEPDSATRFRELQEHLTEAGITFEVAPDIVRGLDYYTDTVFEIQSDALGAQATVCGGGRYDNLIKDIGGAALPSVGFGMGVERLLLVLEAAGKLPEPPVPTAFVAYSGEEKAAFSLVRALRAAGVVVLTDIDGKSLKSQLRQADKSGARFVLLLGEEEVAAGTVTVKDMATGEQRAVTVDRVAEAIQ